MRQHKFSRRFLQRTVANLGMAMAVALAMSGCGRLFGAAAPEPTPSVALVLTPVPTFTPTPITQPAPLPTVAVLVASAASVDLTQSDPVTRSMAITPAATATISPTAAPVLEPRLIVVGDAVNIRSGPATTFALLGTATGGQSFQLVAKNTQGDWWQVCCLNEQPGWIYAELARVENAEAVAVAIEPPTPAQPITATTPAPLEAISTDLPTPAPVATAAPVVAAPPADSSSAGNFDTNAAYQIVHFKVRGLEENNGGTRDSSAQHHIFLTVLDANGNGVDGAVVKNLVGEQGELVTGDKGPGKAEITMYWQPFKLTVATDPSGPTTSQVSNQMGLAFPHLPDIVGRLGGLDYEYAVCPTLEIKCQWPIQAVHFSYEITFQKVK
ncbi:MAG: SH3 domain-containing protein [Chloroflexota bacterium]|nr:SH3 domain-containing protein [Chloroflexota bacterium]